MIGNPKKEIESPQEKDNSLSIRERELLSELVKNISSECVIVVIGENTSELSDTLVSGAEIDGVKIYSFALSGRSYSIRQTDNIILHGGIHEAKNNNVVIILTENAYDLTRRWKETVGLLVIIGYQLHEEVREAVVFWQGYLSPEAIIVVQNRFEPGPAKAINEFAADGGNLLVWRSVDNLTAMLVDKCQHYWAINSKDIGICRSCGRIRNFKRLQKEATETKNIKRTINYMKKQIQKIGR